MFGHDSGGEGQRDPFADPWVNNPKRRRNSPWAILGVLTVIFGIVLLVAIANPSALTDGDDTDPNHAAQPVARDGPHRAKSQNAVLAEGPVMASGVDVSPVVCDLPELDSSAQDLRGYYETAIGCLNRMWQPALEQSGVRFRPPELSLSSDAPCLDAPGDTRPTAFYCEGTIHMPRAWVVRDVGNYEPAHLMLLAHEYGHHVQHLSKALQAAAARGGQHEPGSPAKMQVTRRTELQAECFAGLFMGSAAGHGSVNAEEAESIVTAPGSQQMAESHGTPAHQQQWATAGFTEQNTAECNTWAAQASEVS